MKRRLGRTGLDTTLVGFGALEIGRDWGVGSAAERMRPADAQAGETVRCVLDMGINLIDTASAYHRSEERIGMFAADRRREYILATKCGEHNREPDTFYDFSYDAVRRSIEGSLRLLRTDVIDILQIHFGPDPAQVLDDGGCLRAMKEARAKGQVRVLGASVNGAVLSRCIASGDFDVVQVGYSLVDPGEEENIAEAARRGLGVLIRSGLGGGWLTASALRVPREKRPPLVNTLFDLCGGDASRVTSLALQFIARNPAVGSVLVGSKSCRNLRTAIEMLESDPDVPLLDRAISALKNAAGR